MERYNSTVLFCSWHPDQDLPLTSTPSIHVWSLAGYLSSAAGVKMIIESYKIDPFVLNLDICTYTYMHTHTRSLLYISLEWSDYGLDGSALIFIKINIIATTSKQLAMGTVSSFYRAVKQPDCETQPVTSMFMIRYLERVKIFYLYVPTNHSRLSGFG